MNPSVSDQEGLSVAFELAASMHADQRRKGTEIPYLSHVMAVAALVLEDGGTATEAAAALLHDAAEDQGGLEALKLITKRCGAEVASIVEECSDSLLAVGEEKAPWQERKQKALDALPSKSRGALLVIAADKLHNVRATVTDLAEIGPAVWSRFKTGEAGFVWYHEETLTKLEALLPGSRSVAGLRAELQNLRGTS